MTHTFFIIHACIYYPISLEGKWDFEVVRFSVHYYYPIPQKGMGSCSSLVSCTLLLLSHPPEGDGILFFPGFMYTIIIIPSPIRGWDLVLPWFHVHYCYYPIPHKGMGSCSSLVSCTLLLLSHPPIGDGILFFLGFMYTIIIILLLPCSKQWLRLWPSTQDI